MDAGFPVLKTPRLVLRQHSLADAPAVYEILRRQDVCRWLETAPLGCLEEAQQRVEDRMCLFQQGLGVRWAICLGDAPRNPIGSCGYFSVRRGTQTVEMGFELHPYHWRHGIMSEALQRVILFTFSEQSPNPVHRIEALVAPGNTASLRLLEKLGFEREGLRRDFGFWQGRYQDVYLYALLNRHGTDSIRARE